MLTNSRIKHYLFLRRIHPSVGFGGCEKVLVDWFKGIDCDKTKITLAVTKGSRGIFEDRLKENKLSVNVLEFPFASNGSFIKKLIMLIVFFRKIRPTHLVYTQGTFTDFDLVDILAGYIYSLGNIFITEHAEAVIPENKPVHYYLSFIPKPKVRTYIRKLLFLLRAYLSKRILAVSKTVKERMVKYYDFPESKIYIAYHGVEVDKFVGDINVREKMRKKMNIPEEDMVIISASRLSGEKNLHLIINAFDIIQQNYSNIWLLMVGDGYQRDELLQLANNKSSKKRILFLGFQEDVSDYLKMSDVYVLASGIEEFAIAMLEAMSTGLVPIVAKVPSSYNLIQDGINGFSVEASEKGIVFGLNNVLSFSKDEIKKISINARKFAQENFDLQKNVKAALNILGLE